MREDIDAFVERIVEAAEIPSRQRRDDLRRELRGHFEDGGATPPAQHAAVGRFGDPCDIGRALRTVYRRDYLLFYIVKLGVCMAAATMASIGIETVASLRLEGSANMWHLSPGFAHAAGFGVVLTLALVAAAEVARAPFNWSRALWSLGGYAALSAGAASVRGDTVGAFVAASVLAAIGVGVAKAAARWPAKASLALAAFAAAEYTLHYSLGVAFGPIRVLAASVSLLALWASTTAIVALSDRAFVNAFRAT
jgi:hypothetical protein